MSEEYRLVTIKDIFDKVPADRIADCMDELKKLMIVTKNAAELLRMIAEDVSGKEIAKLHEFPEETIWRDDGKRELTATFGGTEDKPMLSLEIHKLKS